MIIYSRLLKPGGGNLGNALFEIASCIGLSRRYNTEVAFPSNPLFKYLKNPPKIENTAFSIQIEEKTYKFDWSQWDVERELIDNFDVDIKGWLQDSRYWEHCKDEVLQALELKPEFVAWIRSKYSHILTRQTIAISIRRGDYVDNPNYVLLPIRYYIGALLKYFPDFRDNYNIVIFSDDVEYCKRHFECLKNVIYAEGDAIEQHTLMRQCDNYIIANSTFSYWGAYLSINPNKKVITPKYLFEGRLLKKEGNVNFWSNEGWTEFDHSNFKIDLADTTFIIPCYHDHSDRDENISLSIKMLKEDFDCKIIVGENQSSSFSHLGDKYIKFNYPEFHRTRMLNQMAHRSTTSIIVNWDADVIIPPLQILEAVRLIRSKWDMVYPYDGRFARVPRSNYNHVSIYRDIGILCDEFRGTRAYDEKSVGGAIVFNKVRFFDGGGENEHFVSYGPEDRERYHRFKTLEYKIGRIPGILYHIDHEITINSSTDHSKYKTNQSEWEKIESMEKHELRKYVDSWDFTSNYAESYYEEITDITSPIEVYEVLKGWIDFDAVVDIGCGDKSWVRGKGDLAYLGMDMPDFDVRIPVNFDKLENSLVLCLEVAEHIEEKYADILINNLCDISDQILFSAAIPGQGGENHYNEQWQSYWAAKFKERGYHPFYKDVRKSIWNNEKVAIWYRQNMVLYTKHHIPGDYDLDVVHPQMYRNILGI